MSGDKVHHLPASRTPRTQAEEIRETVDLVISAHFREQNELLRQMNQNLTDMNKGLSERVQVLTTGVQRLVGEMDGVRSGNKDQAFARVASNDACADLPTVKADVANLYPFTSAKIGVRLGFGHNQIGLLLGPSGLNWAGNGDYQETTRWQEGHPRYWHADVPGRLSEILTKTAPSDHGIKNRTVVSMFRQWKQRAATEVLATDKPTSGAAGS